MYFVYSLLSNACRSIRHYQAWRTSTVFCLLSTTRSLNRWSSQRLGGRGGFITPIYFRYGFSAVEVHVIHAWLIIDKAFGRFVHLCMLQEIQWYCVPFYSVHPCETSTLSFIFYSYILRTLTFLIDLRSASCSALCNLFSCRKCMREVLTITSRVSFEDARLAGFYFQKGLK